MAQAQSPYDGDNPFLPRTASMEEGRDTRREGRLRRAISRMVRSYEPSETEQGFPVHQPVHPHSQNPGGHASGTGSGGTTGPYSGSAEDRYRPSLPTNVPNPYTTPRVEVDDVDDGTAQTGTWRGVGLDEPEPRSPQPLTTDTMTDTPFPPENAEPDDRHPAPGTDEAPEAPAPNTRARTGSPAPGPVEAPAPGNQPHTGPAQPPAAQQPVPQGQPPVQPPQGWGEEHHRPAAPPPGHHPGQYGHAQPPAGQQPPPYDPYYGYGRPPAPQGYPAPQHPAPQAYGPGYGHHPHQGEYAPPPPVPYAPHPMAYQNAYPAPYHAPGYFYPSQPVMYPGPFGQPVQHIIVFTPGQQPQVVTADAVASTLVPERAEPERNEEGGSERALTTAEPREERESVDKGGDKPASEAQAQTPEPEKGGAAAQQASAPARAEAASEAAGAEGAPEPGRSGAPCTAQDPDLLNEALAGLAMRDLSLVDALLEMVEELETDAQEPELLDKLFQIDNYATRMRRNGENFLVLTGHDGGESDAHDEIVPLLDVARAASSEIKDYPRVRLGTLPQTSLTGLAADDISHLLAELLDNATANSPEHAPVTISARELDDGRLMIVVEDEGVGVPEKQLDELNERLSGEPVLDDEVLRHMGLYVASRIAHKHGLKTRLESRSYRGVSAYTIIPKDLLRVATPRTMNADRASASPSAQAAPAAPAQSAGQVPQQPANGTAQAEHGSSSVTAAGLPRRSATPHGSPLRMMPRPENTPDNKPPARPDTPPRLTGEARAEQIRDELGDFLDGERAAREGEELDGDE